jgi:hypothetical protein
LSFKQYNLPVDLTAFHHLLKRKQINDKVYIKDLIRKRFLVMQPEELVRQLVILYLVEGLKMSINRIQVEKQFMINGLRRRFDLIVYDDQQQPFIIVECKSPSVAVNQQVFDQVAAYNLIIKAPYIVVTNGPEIYCCAMSSDLGGFRFEKEIPKLS